jgi:hypothetical protein
MLLVAALLAISATIGVTAATASATMRPAPVVIIDR